VSVLPLNQDRTLIIFTRYPTPGKVKTRLIPAVGEAGAARLHRQMTVAIVDRARSLSTNLTVKIQVHFDGDNCQQMSDWLGADLDYQTQGIGDIGMRMARSFAMVDQNHSAIVLIGTDCPELTTAILSQAFEQLAAGRDLVLGGSVDGGYYLIGLRRYQPELFVGIDWSTDRVLVQTVEIANHLNLAIGYLPTLPDIDRPADLPVLTKMQLTAKISIVIPTLNEAATIGAILADLQPLPNVEIILVDGGSIDDTVKIAQAVGVQVLTSSPGRARQMNLGAEAATGEILIFLHGDTVLPVGFEGLVRSAVGGVVERNCGGVGERELENLPIAGAFMLKIDDPLPSLRWIEWLVAWRSRWRQMPYGDQAIFLTAETFRQVGGFVEMPIMEDFELIRRLQRRGRIEILSAPVLTSARRWIKRGVWQTTLINQAIVIGYSIGISPARLVRWYRKN
jgi:uncharacterized protein